MPADDIQTDYKFEGWAGLAKDATDGKLQLQSFEPKKWDEDDVDVRIQYCGICGTDISALEGEFGPLPKEGSVCGHEGVGEVVRVGSKVEGGLKVGDIVGIGIQSDCCRECEWCKNGEENVCAKQIVAFNRQYRRGNAGAAKSISKGAFAKYWRGPSRFAIRIPSAMDPASAAPMFCGGVTMFSPLLQYGAGTTAKRVGIIGIGGLGHFGVIFASKMGAEVTAISRGDNKKDDAMKLGATKYIATGSDTKKGIAGHERTLDLIICTINPDHLPVNDYLPLLRPNGTFVLVGLVPEPLSIPSFSLILSQVKVAGSNIGSPATMRKMFDFAVEHDIGTKKSPSPYIQKYNMDDINQALPDFKAGKPRYRFVLVNTDNGAKL